MSDRLPQGIATTYAASYAARSGDIVFIRTLLQNGEAFDLNEVALHAFRSSQQAIISLLVNHGAIHPQPK